MSSSRVPTRGEALGLAKKIAYELRQVGVKPGDVVALDLPETLRLLFSSGTTGQQHAIAFSLALLEFMAADALLTYMSGDPFLVFLPTATTFGFLGLYMSVKGGRPFWSVSAGDPNAIVDLAGRSSATSLKASPAQLAAFVDVLERFGLTLPHVQTVHVTRTRRLRTRLLSRST